MTNQILAEHELAVFLEATHAQSLRTWERQRSSEERRAFVLAKLSALGKLGIS